MVIDTHLRVRPLSDDYWNLRQSILFAISKATEANGIKFAYQDKRKMMTTIAATGGLEDAVVGDNEKDEWMMTLMDQETARNMEPHSNGSSAPPS